MKIPVEIMLTSNRIDYRDGLPVNGELKYAENVENFEGHLTIKKDGFELEYREEFNGFSYMDTHLVYKNGILLYNRKGKNMSNSIVLIEGATCNCVYTAGNRQVGINVNTKRLSTDMCALGGKLHLEYSVDLGGNREEDNTLCFSICPVDSVS